MGIAHTSGAPDGWLGRRGAGFEGKLPRRIVVVGDQFRYERGLCERFRNRDRFRKRSCESHGTLAVTGNPTQRANIADVIVRVERQTIGVFTGPVCVREPVRMLMRWIAIMDVQERSLGKGQQEAGDCAKMACPTHVLLSYRVVKVWALLTGADLRSRRCECAGQQQVTLSTQRPQPKCPEKEMARMD